MEDLECTRLVDRLGKQLHGVHLDLVARQRAPIRADLVKLQFNRKERSVIQCSPYLATNEARAGTENLYRSTCAIEERVNPATVNPKSQQNQQNSLPPVRTLAPRG